MKTAVHFGAGNIGRGFIGLLLYQSGYQTIFIDVNNQVIDEINKQKSYHVYLAGKEKQELTVNHITGINSIKEPDAVTEAIVKADVVTTAVGPTILPVIAKAISKGLQERTKQNNSPLNIIACENMVGGSSLLKEHVFESLEAHKIGEFDRLYGFPDAAVDRIVPNQTNKNLLDVMVEPYYEWVVEKKKIVGEVPPIFGITYVDDLAPYIERKLFTVNTGHAIPAYLGTHLGYDTIVEAMKDLRIDDTIYGALAESGEALIHAYGFNREMHQEYVSKIIQRFQNPYISDDVKRVARGPIRKLGAKDRLVKPALMYIEYTGKIPVYLAKTIAAALLFNNDEDREAIELQKKISATGYQQAFVEVSGCDSDSILTKKVIEQLRLLQNKK
ncbi:mannitol-1-phosphate 5-dehydrogenase [Oceanobacillus iheyensis]|uniref:Mannitol-1-phosphate 5-dehydrogenase n=1 Tax=Oceanobacillus iheyensis (strain DSM 14371 / CIP 107618 / JCM 11309 / KCTC 3954 / HTE831) TaxID=221109 RepID=MTLD_OCEIH|nr:mannitol-1-phosphate 5-dehydrogenase [Oceanobacillus iheyensis]Q8EN87.1 RecName: Full=Mannitol-1-phosphate 5-dehydrogenase [Oceanobacillus iheyensis HTE831]BAC14556.1 mannitol-1-phosphate dehydrogenase [Oceanobacillus iheyensis HTE831]